MKYGESNIHLNELNKKLQNQLKRKKMLYKKMNILSEAKDKFNVYKTVFFDVLRAYDCKSRNFNINICFTQNNLFDLPITFHIDNNIGALFNLGIPPYAHQKSFYKKYYIYPINYRFMRLYFNPKQLDHGFGMLNYNMLDGINAGPSGDYLLIYDCSIKLVEGKIYFQISTDCGINIGGSDPDECWMEFCKLFGNFKIEYPHIEGFFGLNILKIQRIIEKMSNLDKLVTYIPIEKRHGWIPILIDSKQ
ncbi:hypothetical protein TCON_0984 [Astathelohania contejeani]|uniref:Uncharacterized protein n=1 Tax=Astathelohania contejeani TaxID=164912 RepID=A0ABQ7I016_9MICR|nr:hypothetical protein TCON_0984 [Thelohania contejeani]